MNTPESPSTGSLAIEASRILHSVHKLSVTEANKLGIGAFLEAVETSPVQVMKRTKSLGTVSLGPCIPRSTGMPSRRHW